MEKTVKTDYLVSSANGFRQNLLRYRREGLDTPELVRNAAKARSWYFCEGDGGWEFAPSRFAGYHDMTAQKYLEADYLNGTETEHHLKLWSTPVAGDSLQHEKFHEILSRYLAQFGVKPNASVRFNVFSASFDPDHKTPPPDFVELLLGIVERLDFDDRKRFEAELREL